MGIINNWTLRQKVTAIIILQIILLLALQIAVQWRVILPAFKQIEVEQASNAINRITETFLLDLDFLDKFVYEYSYWENSYDFVRFGEQSYIDENLYEGIAIHLGSNIMIYTNQDLEIVWGVEETIDSENVLRNHNEDFLSSVIGQLKADIETIDPKESFDDQSAIGFAIVSDTPSMYSVRPIISDRYGDQNGYLILVKYIDQHLVELYENRLSNQFEINPIDASTSSAITATASTTTASTSTLMTTDNLKNLHIKTVSPTKLSVTNVMHTGTKPVFSISTEIFRKVTINGLNSIYLASAILLIIGILCAAIVWLFTSSYFFKPLEALSNQMQDISSSGDYSKQYQVSRQDEVGSLATSFNQMVAKINSHQHQLEQTQVLLKGANDQLSILVRRDSLTGITNRLAFDEFIEMKWKTFARLQMPLSILMMDIDYFKNYNDIYGHVKGDECLKQVAQILSNCVKRSNDILARYGGEEFIATLADLSDTEVQNIAENILAKVREANIIHENSEVANHITLSIGIATIVPNNQMDYKELVDKADRALYLSKASGRNQITVYNFGNNQQNQPVPSLNAETYSENPNTKLNN